MHRTTRRVGTSLVASVGLLAAALATGPAAQARAYCASGHACIVEKGKFGLRHATVDWYRYGAYNLSGQYGWKAIDNQQTDGAVVRTYSGYNGTGRVLNTVWPGPQGENMWPIDFTPINSVVLSPT